MDFPAYVPAAVRAHITHYIEGNGGHWEGWDVVLAHPDKELAKIEEEIENYHKYNSNKLSEYITRLNKRRAEIVEHRQGISADVACMRRLVYDERMQKAYALLTAEFNEDQQWDRFIHAAWAARTDYLKHRERLKQANEIRKEIADTAEHLAALLDKYAETGIQGASAMFHIPTLLEDTANIKKHRVDYMWSTMSAYILGKEPETESKKSDLAATIRYTWGTAPPVSVLLEALAIAANEFEPTHNSVFITAATSSKKRNEKTEYIRAFAALLKERDFQMIPAIMQAMAIVTAVVINSPEIDVTYDDVRKATK